MNVRIVGCAMLVCRNSDGSFAWKRYCQNGITNQGLDYLGSVGHTGGAQITNWFASLINNQNFSKLDQRDTMASHAGWFEYTGYSGSRPQWVNTESNQLVSSNGPFTFPITSNGNVAGFFICSSSVVGGTSGTLWCTALVSPVVQVSVGQSVTGTYQYSLVGG